MTTTDTPARKRLTVVPIAIVLALLLTSCPGDEVSEDDCACPNLRAAAESIDWLGDGTAPVLVETNIAVAPYLLQTRVLLETSDQVVSQQQTENRLKEAGFTIVDDRVFSARFESRDWSVGVGTSGTDEEPRVSIVVRIIDDDARAAEILAPVSEALGTLP